MNLILIEKFLTDFRCCFQHTMTFNWFLVIILGFIVRSDHLGVSSFVRCFYLQSKAYNSLLFFFRSSAWSLTDLLDRWVEIVCNKFPLLYIKKIYLSFYPLETNTFPSGATQKSWRFFLSPDSYSGASNIA
jgi:hypothetical protein